MVEDYARKYPEVRRELEEIEIALEQYIKLQKIPPPRNLEGEIMQKIDELENQPRIPDQSASGTGLQRGLPLLLTLLLLAALGSVFWLYQQNNRINNQLAILQDQMETLEADCDFARQRSQALQEQLDVLRDVNNTSIVMSGANTGTGKAPEALAKIYVDQQSQKAYLDILNLPEPPSDRQYQLWAIVDGQPVDMGVFDLAIDSRGFQEVPFIPNAQAYAVTLETRGGNPTPNLQELYVIGNVS